MKRVLVSVVVGVLVGGGVHQLFAPHWQVVLVTGIIYTAAAYFYFSAVPARLQPEFSFDNRTDAIGYGIGLFGLSVSPIAFGNYYTAADIDPVFLIWFIGILSHLTFATVVGQRTDDRGT